MFGRVPECGKRKKELAPLRIRLEFLLTCGSMSRFCETHLIPVTRIKRQERDVILQQKSAEVTEQIFAKRAFEKSAELFL